MGSIFRQLFYRIYQIGLIESNKRERLRRGHQLEQSAIVGRGTVIEDEAIIQNSQKDSAKIIIGNRCHIKGYLMLFKHGGAISIGDDSFIGSGTKIWSAKKISIGSRVLISHNVNIHDNISHPLDSMKRHKDFMHIFNVGDFQESNDLREKEIEIADDVWIGFNSTIMKGVRIGKGAIIGSNTVITKDVPEYSVAVGNPSRIIKSVN